MIICVIATASALRGALAIYCQFVDSLRIYGGNDEWHLFLDDHMPMPEIPHVAYHVYHTKGFGRMWFDFFGFRQACKNIGINPDIIFSLQNTGVRFKNKRNVIYYHQSIPLYRYKVGLFDKSIKEHLFYNYYYPLYVKWLMNHRTYVAVQTDTIKDLFAKRYHFPKEKIGVYFPNVEKVNGDNVKPYQYEADTFNFLYPAMGAAYKEHMTLAYALEIVCKEKPYIGRQIRIHLTLKEGDVKGLEQFLVAYGLSQQFIFHGNLAHDDILSMLKSGDGLLFPSVVETLGLPLLEGASLGVPVVANDMPYVHDVLMPYEGVRYVTKHDYEGWAHQIISCCEMRKQYAPLVINNNSSWARLFKLIREGVVI